MAFSTKFKKTWVGKDIGCNFFDSVLPGLSDGPVNVLPGLSDVCVLSPAPAYRYPFYAVQWHPEKSPFEWVDKPGMVHLGSAVRASFYTASFFISEGEEEGGKGG